MNRRGEPSTEAELLRLYALALLLVPDHSAAGDLFMDARSESDLRRRAAAWRREHELHPTLGANEGALPALSPEEQEHALHLHRRGVLRRRMQLGLAAGAAVVLVASLVLALSGPLRHIASDPAFAGQPLDRSGSVGGRQFTIWKAEATPGAVTVWWEITGSGLAQVARTKVEPELVLSGTGTDWLRPVAGDQHLERPDRLVGHSTYNILVDREDAVVLHVADLAGEPVRWLLRAPLTAASAEPGARIITTDATADLGVFSATVKQVVLAPTYTLLRYEPRHKVSEATLRHFLRVEAGGRLLEPVGPPAVDDGEVTAIFGAVPAGAGELTLHLDFARPLLVDPIPSRDELTGLFRAADGQVIAQLALSTYLLDRQTTSPLPLPDWPWPLEGSYLVGEGGERYGTTVIYQGEDPSRHLTLWRLQADVPPQVDIRTLQLHLLRLDRGDGTVLRIPLK
jgi:hypothetical protein